LLEAKSGASPSLAILAAEPSGDLQGAALAQELRKRRPSLKLFGVGGRHMRRAAVELLFDSSVYGTVGPVEAIPRLPEMWRRYAHIRDEIARRRPDLVVMIDSPGAHMRLAGALQGHGIRSLYYFPPSAWSDNLDRARQVSGRVDGVLAAFEYTSRVYQRGSLPIAYFGHPLVDLIAPLPAAEARRTLGLEEGDYVALLPGSRTQEVRLTLPVLLEVARLMRLVRPHLRFLLPCASVPIEAQVRRQIGDVPPWLYLVSGYSREALACSRLALITSGSATLEAALLNTPLVLFYRVNWFDYSLGWLLVNSGLMKLGRFGLPNLLLGEDVVPEFLQNEATPVRLYSEAMALLEDGPRRERMLADLARVREVLGPPGSVARIAAFVDHFARGLSLEEAVAATEGAA